ncbi:MAG: dependent oxidoreductase [Planctomycetaceae bacterium]|nr:dependent oxidoreductase [Planctomycetaceae bacterium]
MNVILDTDVVIFGGGCAGLWLLDELRRRGFRAILLESGQLGGGQTTASQGILHGGVKYILQGAFSASASAVKKMPGVWSSARSGTIEPNLSAMRMRSTCCFLWRSDSWQSWAGLIGARAMLEVKPIPLAIEERPAVLSSCPGHVYRLEEEVIDTSSFAQVMADRNRGLILQINPQQDPEFQIGSDGHVEALQIRHSNSQSVLTLTLKHLVLTSGAGNERLRQRLDLPANAMQRRPLHMVLARGDLPLLTGHCVDGARTRVTITSDEDSAGRIVWQIGGQLAEDGVRMTPEELIQFARQELFAVLPRWIPSRLEWSTYRIDRAEAKTKDGARPDDVQLLQERNVLTAWPTKLVLAPRMAERVIEQLGALEIREPTHFQAALADLNWPTPSVALPPWELQSTWIKDN